MTNNLDSAGQKLLSAWQKLHTKPIGRWLFKQIMAKNVPYTGSIKADVQKLSPGYCEIKLKYRKSNTNHLNSVHALALANLGEYASGLAMMTALPPDVRGIVTQIKTSYLKKARGNLLAIAQVDVPQIIKPGTTHLIEAKIYDNDQDLVTQVAIQWLLSPKQERT